MALRPILGLILATVLISSAARAESIDSRQRTARTSCLSGDYAKGVAILSELFVDTRDPTHIYNQGRCFEQNRRYEDAIGRFQEYLRVGRSLTPEEVAEAKKHIADCRQLQSEQAGPAPRPAEAPIVGPTAPVSPEPRGAGTVASVVQQPTSAAQSESSDEKAGRGMRVAGIAVAAGGVAGIAAGVLLSLKANSMSSDMEKLDGYTSDKESSRKTYRNLGFVAYGVGAACIATGGVLYILGLRATTTQTRSLAFSPIVAPDGAGAAITGGF